MYNVNTKQDKKCSSCIALLCRLTKTRYLCCTCCCKYPSNSMWTYMHCCKAKATLHVLLASKQVYFAEL